MMLAAMDELNQFKVGVISLGCAKNLVDTEVALGHFVQAGATITRNEFEADALIVNTCGFIEAAKAESIDEILAAAEMKRKGKCKCLVVVGCLAERYGEQLRRELPEVDRFIGVGDPAAILDAVKDALGMASPVATSPRDPDYLYSHTTPRLRATPPWTAWVKIAEGCDHECAFCVIPEIRGRFRSRAVDSVVAEVNALVSEGVREVNLIAQDTTRFGQDRPSLGDQADLNTLLNALVRETSVEWIRLLYCFPDRLNDRVIDTIAKYDRIVPYIDLPLQHVSEHILRAMKRPGDGERYAELVNSVRSRIRNVAVRTAFIVGLPGETEDDFRQLRDFVEATRFDRLFVFEYSREEGTAAALMENQVPGEIAEQRCQNLMALQARISQQINESLVGTETIVLCETRDGMTKGSRMIVGRSERDAPEVDLQVRVMCTGAEPGQFVRARITKAFEYDLVAVATTEPW